MKKFNKLFTILFATLFLFVPGAQAVASLMPLTAQNGHIVDSSRRQVILHGLAVMSKTPPYEPSAAGFSARSAQFMQQAGFNAVRLGVTWAAIEPIPGHYNDQYLSNIKATIQLLAKYGMYSVIDFHQDAYSAKDDFGAGMPKWSALGHDTVSSDYNPGFPLNYYGGFKIDGKIVSTELDDNFTQFWKDKRIPAENVGVQEAYINMLKHTVEYLGKMPSIAGYEIMNEPFIGDAWRRCIKSKLNPKGGCRQFETTVLKPFTIAAARAIHSVNPQAIAWFEPQVAFLLGDPTYIGGLDEPNVGFAFHDYDLKSSVPINYAVNGQQKIFHLPLLITEFGAVSSAKNLTNITNLCDQNAISWTEWALFNNPKFKFPEVNGKVIQDPRQQGIIYDIRKPYTGDNVRWDRLVALTRIYPAFVAGTNVKFNYDAPTRSFTLSFKANTAKTKTANSTVIIVPNYSPGEFKLELSNAHLIAVHGNRLTFISNPSAAVKIALEFIVQHKS